ncbi:hypothetical protein DV736_g5246, partial [Chaetothyriales sp. CBS 134916]
MSSQVPLSTKIGHRLAKVLRIDLDERQQQREATLTRGESAYTASTADTYVEEEPRSIDWIKEHIPNGRGVINYLLSLFPFLNWIHRYNLQWFAGDLVAGITVGAVVVPQGMAYAQLAELPIQFGLYTSFMGVLIYWFFATSKDITIGPVAVMSKIVGNIILKVQKEHPDIPGHVVASALAVIAGSIICFIGLIRWGFIVDFIPLTAISAFMTGSALNIAAGQVPTLMGISSKLFNTRANTYWVIINSLKYLGHSKLDAALGLTALFFLYFYRWACGYLAKKYPARAKTFFFINTLRAVLVILIYILVAYLMERHHRKKPTIKILGKVPRGFKDAGAPTINKEIIVAFADQLPASVIVLLIEHIAISKSFGRVNNYTINPSQEMVAIGVSNILGPFLGAYPATGSFSRTAIKSKAGVRTPLAGVITAAVVLLAIYALPAMFFYIPNSALAAVIIHAVGDLITPPNTVYQFWRVNPLEVLIFFAGVFVSVFSTIENGVYVTICVSAGLLLWRLVKAKGYFLGRVKVYSVLGDHLLEDKFLDQSSRNPLDSPEEQTRNVFLPINHNDGSNPDITVEAPYPGVFIFRFSEGYNYPNASYYTDQLVAYLFAHTRRTSPNSFGRPGDRPWNNPGPRKGLADDTSSHLPILKAVILDFASVNNIDVTSVQNLIDVRNQLDRYASPGVVQWHFASVNNRWSKRALAAAGFGYPSVPDEEYSRWKPIFSIAEIGGSASAASAAEARENKIRAKSKVDIEAAVNATAGANATTTATQTQAATSRKPGAAATATAYPPSDSSGDANSLNKEITQSKAYAAASVKRQYLTTGLNRPLFHIDLTTALQSAIANAKTEELYHAKPGVENNTDLGAGAKDQEEQEVVKGSKGEEIKLQ